MCTATSVCDADGTQAERERENQRQHITKMCVCVRACKHDVCSWKQEEDITLCLNPLPEPKACIFFKPRLLACYIGAHIQPLVHMLPQFVLITSELCFHSPG